MAAAVECEDSTYSSTSEAEPDSDHDPDPDDPQKLLGTWLGELENLKMGLENVVPAIKAPFPRGDKLSFLAPRMDSYRFSMANLEDSQDVELDAILGELCALETQFDRAILRKGHARSASSVSQNSGTTDVSRTSLSVALPGNGCQLTPFSQLSQKSVGHGRSGSGGTRPKFEIGGPHPGDVENEDAVRTQKSEYGLRTDSPDNDSAFSDNVSMLSSESSASSGGGAARTDVSSQSMSSKSSSMSLSSSPTQLLDCISHRLHVIQIEIEDNFPPAEQAARIKAEKIKIALEKIREASIKKLFIKAFSADNSAKSLLVDERMVVGHICRLLADKNHVSMDPKWTIVEHIPDLYMERVYEDHEFLVENLLLWTRDSCNRLLFLEKEEKYDLFSNPEAYLLGGSSSEKGAELDDDAKITLLEEFFSSSGVGVPEVEGHLYLKSDGKKAWKKHFFVLRASGLYYCPKGKSKLSKDLVCLTTFEMNNVYVGFGWKKKYKAPTDYGFAVKHPQIQTKSSKYIKYLCTDDEASLRLWVMGIRIAKYGRQLKDNYDSLMRDIVEEDLDSLAHARSFSICSMAKTLVVSPDGSSSPGSPERRELLGEDGLPSSPSGLSGVDCVETDAASNRSSDSTPTPTLVEPRVRLPGTVGRQDSVKSSASGSSGCLSERSGAGTPTMEQIAFDADFPVGTIKRKPSMTPKIPLTNTTRTIAKQSVGDDVLNNVVGLDSVSLGSSSSSSGSSIAGSIGRSAAVRLSLRRSHTDDRITLNGLKKVFQKQISVDSGLPKMHSEGARRDVDDLPLPPPPPELGSLENFDSVLPPPPPEAFRGSSQSLDSLPPPPVPLEEETSWPSTSSLNSLPPPPSPLLQSPASGSPQQGRSGEGSPTTAGESKQSPAVPPKPGTRPFQRRMSETDVMARSPPPYLAELKKGQCSTSPRTMHRFHQNRRKPSMDPNVISCYGTTPRSSASLRSHSRNGHKNLEDLFVAPRSLHERRASAPPAPQPLTLVPSPSEPKEPSLPVHSVAGDATLLRGRSRSLPKPQPPKRSETTKLTGNGPAVVRRSSSSAGSSGYAPGMAPPESFLRDLHRVMEKKWKVAQQLSMDVSATPHQILGFRDPCYLPPAEHERRPSPTRPPPPPPQFFHGPVQHRSRSSSHGKHHSRKTAEDIHCAVTPKKRPPPPPPKRSETTQLSWRQ